VFPFIGLPEKIISDRDTQFTSKVFKEVCELLKVQQKMASIYHPQTDGQSKKTNQHVETALRIFGNFQQDDWSDLLPVIQYQLNLHFSTATKQTPYETWMGFIPRAHQPIRESLVPAVEECKVQLKQAWKVATEVINHAQCRDSLLYKGSEDDDELRLEVTGWVWNKRTKTKTMMTATRMRVKGSMVAVRLRLWGVDKRTV
jgi:hypothetical protein